ncbi:glycosyltransferase [Streptomyces sp. NPDC005573]|uniref:glycosyltransferase n=1 Tax=Streptomyces sp. NPDC005573 TaxID=3156890 RepID=UPI0033B2A4CF
MDDTRPTGTGRRVCVVGAGFRFTGGLSHYTCRLAGALAGHTEVTAILMRRLLPRFLYPGRARVGQKFAGIDYDERVEVYDGVDWYWLPSLFGAVRLLRRRRPEVLVLQWWTGTVAHTYLVLALVARSVGATVVVEFHEVQDTGEIRVPFVAGYTRRLLGALLRRSNAFVVHSEHDRRALGELFDLSERPVTVVPHGPFDHYSVERTPSPHGVCRLLFFGLIRPYKGLEHLIDAIELLSDEEAEGFRLTVVGETWEGCTEPIERIAASPRRDLITLVNRYVTDDEAKEHFARTDTLVLPYLRSSASGPLHIAMSNGIPVVLSAVGGLVEAAEDYEGAVFVPPADPRALAEGLLKARTATGTHYADPHSWDRNARAVLVHLDGSPGTGTT